MQANRAVLVLTATTALVVLVAVLFFTGFDDILGPSRAPEPSIDGGGRFAVPAILPEEASARGGPEGKPRGAARETPGPDAAGGPAPLTGLPLTVAVVDVETGRPLFDAQPLLVVPDAGPIRLVRTGPEFVLARSTAVPGRSVTMRFAVEVPHRYGLARPKGFRVSATISRFADFVRVTIPAWPLVPVLLTVLDHENEPVAGARVTKVTLARFSREGWSAPTDAAGRTRWWGVPAIRGERVAVSVSEAGRSRTVYGSIIDYETPTKVIAILPKNTEISIGIGGGAGGAFGGRGGHRNLVASSDVARGLIEVLVRRADGRPAADALVVALRRSASARTDSQGRVVFKALVPGRIELVVREPGFAMGPPVAVSVVGGRSSFAEITESYARWTTVEVLDHEGNALPGASVELVAGGPVPWVCLDGNVQHLNVLSGADGRVVIPLFPPSARVALAKYGSRRATATIRPDGVTTIRTKSGGL